MIIMYYFINRAGSMWFIDNYVRIWCIAICTYIYVAMIKPSLLPLALSSISKLNFILLPVRSLSSVVFISNPCCLLVLLLGNNGDQE